VDEPAAEGVAALLAAWIRRSSVDRSRRVESTGMQGATDVDWPIRLAAFNGLESRVRTYGELLPWAVIEQGFVYADRAFLFANQSKGIFRPAGMRDAALSVKSTVPRSGVPKYEDIQTDDAFFYSFQSRGLEYHDNRLLLRAIEGRMPMIYFYGIEPGVYRPLWPVYATLATERYGVLLSVEPRDALLSPGEHLADPLMRTVVRRYATVEAKKRLHQDAFRSAVLRAYEQRCAVCRMPRRELLDAAHIVRDSDVRGEPVVPNGLALCKLHHGAYDANLIGIRPDHVIHVSARLLAEHDGPTLEFALKGYDGHAISIPRRADQRPNAEHLSERYEVFRRTA